MLKGHLMAMASSIQSCNEFDSLAVSLKLLCQVDQVMPLFWHLSGHLSAATEPRSSTCEICGAGELTRTISPRVLSK